MLHEAPSSSSASPLRLAEALFALFRGQVRSAQDASDVNLVLVDATGDVSRVPGIRAWLAARAHAVPVVDCRWVTDSVAQGTQLPLDRYIVGS